MSFTIGWDGWKAEEPESRKIVSSLEWVGYHFH